MQFFPHPPYHYKHFLIEPSLSPLSKIYKQYYSFGKIENFNQEKKEELDNSINYKKELIEINKEIISKTINIFEAASSNSINIKKLSDELSLLLNKFFKITFLLKITLEAKKNILICQKKEIETIEFNIIKLKTGLKIFFEKLSQN